MKKILAIGLLILLFGCSEELEIHENVDKDLATDTMQVIDILEELAKDSKEPSDKQQTVFDSYIEKYSYQLEAGNLEGVANERIYEYTENVMTFHLDRVISLDSGSDYVEDLRITVNRYIRDGE